MNVLFWILLPILCLIVFVMWVMETPADRAKRWRNNGISKAEIGRRLNVTKYRVNKLLDA